MREYTETKDNYPHPLERDVAKVTAEISTLIKEFHWAPGRVLYDDPASINDVHLRTLSSPSFSDWGPRSRANC